MMEKLSTLAFQNQFVREEKGRRPGSSKENPICHNHRLIHVMDAMLSPGTYFKNKKVLKIVDCILRGSVLEKM